MCIRNCVSLAAEWATRGYRINVATALSSVTLNAEGAILAVGVSFEDGEPS